MARGRRIDMCNVAWPGGAINNRLGAYVAAPMSDPDATEGHQGGSVQASSVPVVRGFRYAVDL